AAQRAMGGRAGRRRGRRGWVVKAAKVKAPANAVQTFGPRGLYPLTRAMIERRDKLALGLGYVIRNPCSFNAPGVEVPADRRFDCIESAAFDAEHDGHRAASA